MILLNGEKVEFIKFPYAEVKLDLDAHLLRDEPGDTNTITFMYENDGELIRLMFVKKEIDAYCLNAKTGLDVAFMPYARMDRESEDSCFTLKYVSEFINFLNFVWVDIYEPHSDVCIALVNRSKAIELTKWLFAEAVSSGKIEFDPEKDFVCYPDATAHKRYSKMGNYNAAIGMKDRDFKTGWIKNLEIFVPGNVEDPARMLVANGGVAGRNVVIVDDLCSKGGTFILTAKKLREYGAKTVTLVVGHCEPSILDGEILKTDLIDCVVTSNTIIDQNKLASFPKVFVADFMDCQ